MTRNDPNTALDSRAFRDDMGLAAAGTGFSPYVQAPQGTAGFSP